MRRMAIVLLALSAAMPSAAQDVESRLKALEEEVAALKRENAQLRRDLGLEVEARQPDVRTSGATTSVQIGGLIQAQAEDGARVDDRFSDDRPRVFLRRARLNVAGRFLDEFSFRTELDLAGSLGSASGARAQLTDAYVAWGRFRAANIRAGQFKTPFGFEQSYLDPRLYTIERSLANDRLTASRQIGVQISGDIVPDRFTYAAGAFNGNGTNVTTNDNGRFLLAGRLAGAVVARRTLRVNIGGNAFTTRDTGTVLGPEFGFANNTFTGRRTAAGADMQAISGPFELWTEYLTSTFDSDSARAFRARGWYAQASWLAPGQRIQFVGKYDAFDPNDAHGRDGIHTTTLGINYFIHADDVKLQLDWLASQTGHRVLARLQTIF